MTDFFEDVGQIKAWMSVIRKNVGSIEEIYGHYITAVSADQVTPLLKKDGRARACVRACVQ